MADNLKIAIRLVADGSDFRAEVNQATRALDRLGATAGAVDGAMANHGRTLSRTGGELDALSARSRALAETQSGAARAMDQMARTAVALGAGLSVGKLIEYADGWKSVQSRLKLVTDGAAELHAAQTALFEVAQRTRQSFDDTADTFARFARATQGMGVSSGDILRVTETINQAVAISGGPAASAEAALFQLGQAMASGALRGDELNSVLEQTPRLAEAIATGMGRSTGELRSMAEQGKLTSDAVLRALLNQGAAVNREFGQITPTVASSMTMLHNAVQKYVGETDQAWGTTRALAGGVASLANNLDAVAGVAGKAALGVAAIGAARLIPTGVQALTTAIDDQRVALYAKAVATVEAANAEKLAAAQSLITAQRAQATTAATLAVAEAEFASRAAAASSAAAGVTAAEVTLTQARAKTLLTTNVYVASKALAAERDAQAAATVAREASIAADAEKAASLARLRVAQAEAAAAGGAVAAANTHLTIAAEGAAAASGALAQRASLVSAAWAGAQRAGAALLGLVGGPLGAGFLALSATVAYFATRQSAAEKAARDHADALRLIGSSAEALEQKLTKVGAALTNVDKLQIREKLAQAEENMAATRGSLGTANSTTGLLGRWVSIGVQASNEIEAIGQKFAGATFNAEAYGEELAKLAIRNGDNKSLVLFITDLLRTVDAYKAAQADAKKYRDALNGLASGNDAAENFLSRFTNKLGELGGKLGDIAEKARALQALPGLPRKLEELVGSPPPMTEGGTGYTDRHGTSQDQATQRYEANKEVAKIYLGRLTEAEAKEQIRLVGEQVKAERDYQKAVAGTHVVEIAKAEAKKKVADAVANGFPVAQKDKLLEQETALALERVSGAAGAAATDLGAATTATMRLAQAAGAGEAAQRAATYANKEAEATLKGGIALSAVRAANAQDEAAAILTLRNETVRGLALETANTNALTTAMAAGGEAVRTAQENEYKLGLIRKFGADATVAGTEAQRALNDALDAYRANRAANDNNKLEQERRAANDNLALAQRELALMGEAEGVRSRALETMRNQQEAARKVVELGEEGARQWLAWQEQLADTRSLVDFQKQVRDTAKDMAKDVAETWYDSLTGQGGLKKWQDFGAAIGKRIAVGLLENQIILPIMTQVVGAAPQLFGVQAPANAATRAGASTVGVPSSIGGFNTSFLNNNFGSVGRGINDALATPVWSYSSGPGMLDNVASAQDLFSAGQSGAWSGGAWQTPSNYSVGDALGSAGYGIGAVMNFANGNIAGGIGNTAATVMSFIPGLQAIAPLAAIAGQLLGGLFGKDRGKPAAAASVTVDPRGNVIQSAADTDNEGDPQQAAQLRDSLVKATQAFTVAVGGLRGDMAVGVEAKDGQYRRRQNGELTGSYGTLDEAVIAAFKDNISGGLIDASKEVLQAVSASAASDISEFLKDVALGKSIGDATAGLQELDTSLAGITSRAKTAAAASYATATEEKARADALGLGAQYAAVVEQQIRKSWQTATATWTPLETAIAQADGRAAALKESIKAMGLAIRDADVDAARLAEITTLRNQALSGVERAIRESQGESWRNSLDDLVAADASRRRDFAAVGLSDYSRVDALLSAQVQSTLEAAGLTADALRALTAAYADQPAVLAGVQAALGKIAGTAASEAAQAAADAAKAAADAAKASTDAQIAVQRALADGWTRIRDQALAAVTSLRLDANLSTLGAKARLDLAESEMSAAYSRIFAATNDNERDKAASDFNSLWRPYLEQSRAYYADQPEYQARQDKVLSMQAMLASRAGEQVDAAGRALAVAEQQLAALSSIDARLASGGTTGAGVPASNSGPGGSYTGVAGSNYRWVQTDTGWKVEQYATGAAALGQGVYHRPTMFRELAENGQPEAIMPLANVGGRLGIHAVLSTGGSAAPVDMTPVVVAVGATSGAVLEIGAMIAARLDTMIGQNAAILRELAESRRINRDLVTVLERRAA